jgi:pimeloyl-ACP methyl ester carboxylesterase
MSTTLPFTSRRRFLRLGASGLALGAGLAVTGRGALAQQTRSSQQRDEAEPTITHRRIRTNGIDMHIAEAGTGPLVVLVHGWPELWYSWRHQLPALAAAGFHAVAPDLRGYGETDAPASVESYSLRNQMADILGLLDALGVERAVFVGHDIGAGITWALAELVPQRVAGHVSLGSPYGPRSPVPPVQGTRDFAGNAFSFLDYFNKPGVGEAELGADPRRTLRLFLYALSGDAPPDLVPYLFTGKPADAGVLDGMPEPAELPAWLTEADLDVYARAYTRTGFRGSLGGYRNMDRDWADLPAVGATGVSQPALLVGGRRDTILRFVGDFAPMEAAVPNVRRIVLLPGCGHWTQQERPADVNAELIDFLQREQWG